MPGPWLRLGCHKMVSAHLPKRPFFLAGAAFLTAFFATFFTGAFFATTFFATFFTGAFFTGAFFATTFFATFFTGFGFGFTTGLGRALGAGGSTIEPLTGPGKNMATSDERTADRATRDTGALKAELRNEQEDVVGAKGWAVAQAGVARRARTRDARRWRGGWLT